MLSMEKQSSSHRRRHYLLGKAEFRRDLGFRLLVSNKFDCPIQSPASDISDNLERQYVFPELSLQLLTHILHASEQIVALYYLLNLQGSCARESMVLERSEGCYFSSFELEFTYLKRLRVRNSSCSGPED